MANRLKKGQVIWYTVVDCNGKVYCFHRDDTREEAMLFKRNLEKEDRETPRLAYCAGPYRIAKLVVD
jgi:hypothetical protein